MFDMQHFSTTYFFNLIFRESSDEDEEIAEAMAEINKFEEKLKQREAINQEKF